MARWSWRQGPPPPPGVHRGLHLSVVENRRVDAPAKLIGRERELAGLEQALDRLPAAVVIEGEPGIGKSRLLAELERRASSLGARASQAEMDLPTRSSPRRSRPACASADRAARPRGRVDPQLRPGPACRRPSARSPPRAPGAARAARRAGADRAARAL